MSTTLTPIQFRGSNVAISHRLEFKIEAETRTSGIDDSDDGKVCQTLGNGFSLN